MSFAAVIKRPSAYLPLIFSGAALAIVLGYLALYGAARQSDEGAAAHLFQLLLVAEVPIIGYYAFRWLPKSGRPGWAVFGLQLGAVAVALAPIFVLGM